jgi:hypothetical protein
VPASYVGPASAACVTRSTQALERPAGGVYSVHVPVAKCSPQNSANVDMLGAGGAGGDGWTKCFANLQTTTPHLLSKRRLQKSFCQLVKAVGWQREIR